MFSKVVNGINRIRGKEPIGADHTTPPQPRHARSDPYARLFDPSRYEHWGVIERLRTVRFHKYYVGIVKQYAVFFDFHTSDFEAIFDLTDCQVSPIQNREFAVQGVRLFSCHLLRVNTDTEVEQWHAHFLRAAHFREDRAHERRLTERRRRLEQERQQRMNRAAEQAEVRLGEPAVAFDYEARMAQLLAEVPTDLDGSHFICFDGDQVAPACPKCRRSYVDSEQAPLVLSCHHNVCSSCVQGMVQGNHIQCNRCSKKTPVPAEGITALPHNYALSDLSAEDIHMLRRLNKRDALDTMDSLCPVCFDPFGDTSTPMVLRCGHSVCDSCLKLMAKAAKSSSSIKCPECRVTTDLATSDVTVNFALKATLEEILRLKSLPDDNKHSTVARKGNAPKAKARARKGPHSLGKAALRNCEVSDCEVEEDELLRLACDNFHNDLASGRISLDQSPDSPTDRDTSSDVRPKPKPKAKPKARAAPGSAHGGAGQGGGSSSPL